MIIRSFESVRMVVARELRDREKINQVGSALQHLLRYAYEREDMLNRLLLGMNYGCITTNPNQSVLQCNGHIQVHLQPQA
jgi:hypothetical protein